MGGGGQKILTYGEKSLPGQRMTDGERSSKKSCEYETGAGRATTVSTYKKEKCTAKSQLRLGLGE